MLMFRSTLAEFRFEDKRVASGIVFPWLKPFKHFNHLIVGFPRDNWSRLKASVFLDEDDRLTCDLLHGANLDGDRYLPLRPADDRVDKGSGREG